MRKSGETDLEISAEYCEYKWEEWSREVSLSYSSESIDQFYTTEWEDDNCTQLVADLKYMRNIRDKYCGEYTYQVEGKEIHIFFKDSYTDFFHVRSSNHEYHIYTYNAKTSLSIDGDLMYYSGGASVILRHQVAQSLIALQMAHQRNRIVAKVRSKKRKRVIHMMFMIIPMRKIFMMIITMISGITKKQKIIIMRHGIKLT